MLSNWCSIDHKLGESHTSPISEERHLGVKSCVYWEVSALWRISEPELCVHLFYPPLCQEALTALLCMHYQHPGLQSQFHSWIPNRNVFWLFHSSLLWMEEKQTQDTNQSSQIEVHGTAAKRSQAGPQPSPQWPIPHFTITRGVRLFDRNWFWPDLQDLGKHSSGEYIVWAFTSICQKKF